MANEWDYHKAVVEVFERDGSSTGSTGVCGLTGKANPLRVWGDRGMNDRPIVTHYVPAAGVRRGTKDALRLTSQFDVWVEQDSTGLGAQLADRIEAIMTHTNLNSTANTTRVDATPYLTSRRQLPELDEGRTRWVLEFETWFNR